MADPILLSDLLADTRSEVDRLVAGASAVRPDRALLARALAVADDAVDAGIRKACDQDILGLLVEGWSKAHELRALADPDKHPAAEVATMMLASHDLKIAIDPKLTLVVGTLLRLPLKLIADFTATVSAARLTVQNGRIIAVGIGETRFAARLRWDQTELPLSLRQPVVTFPGVFPLDPGIAIPR